MQLIKQDKGIADIRATMPMVKGGGRIDVVSSANPGYFQELVEGRAK